MSQHAVSAEQSHLEVRKQAIMVGLRPFLSAQACDEAVRRWEKEFSRLPRFALQAFIKQLVTPADPLWPYRKEMVLNVTKVMALPAKEIATQYAQMFQMPPDNIAAPSVQEPTQPVFEQLYQCLLEYVEAEDYPVAVRLRKFLREKMLQGGSFSMETRLLNSWLLGLQAELEVSLSLAQMQQLVHLAYLGCCEYLGPVRADRLLGQALENVEQKTRGGLSPRVLL